MIATNGGRLAVLGELFATEARRRGLAGVVIDGYCRDVHGLRALGLPVFARGTIPASGSTVSRAPLRAPVRCGGIDVTPGDLVFADDDGIVIAPAAQVEAALETAETIAAKERAMLAAMAPRRGAARPDQLRRARGGARRRPRERARLHDRCRRALTGAHLFAHRAGVRGGEELAAILAGVPDGVLALTGGFPNPATFATDVLGDIAARVLRDEPGLALQYTPVEGIASVREYLRRPPGGAAGRAAAEALMVTSGGMECLALVCSALLDPGDAIAVEGPTYLGALMAFRGAEADVHEIPMDEDGLVVDALRGAARGRRCARSCSTSSPSTRTRPAGRCRWSGARRSSSCAAAHGVLILEDVAYRELAWGAEPLPTLWSLAPRRRRAGGHVLEGLLPGRAARLGGRPGRDRRPARRRQGQHGPVRGRARPADGRGVRPRRPLRAPSSRALASSTPPTGARSTARCAPGCPTASRGPSRPAASSRGSRCPGSLDAMALREAALDAGVAYVPGAPFYACDAGAERAPALLQRSRRGGPRRGRPPAGLRDPRRAVDVPPNAAGARARARPAGACRAAPRRGRRRRPRARRRSRGARR